MIRRVVGWAMVPAVLIVLLAPGLASAQTGLPALAVTTSADGEQTYTLSIQVLAAMTALSFVPVALMMMTSFTRIIIVLAILRQAIGLAQAPSSQTLVGLALFLTFFIMAPVFSQIHDNAIEPYLNDHIGWQEAMTKGAAPLREFMLGQTREADLNMFATIAGEQNVESAETAPMRLLIPSFVTSELKTAFQIGFLLFIPFLVIDIVVASVLMSMGMMMLSPMIVALPFKIMLFVLVDGWGLVMGTLASSFYV
ncbi:MAG: flagellar biosynthesis protein flip [Gammaproteobacteria bacterium SG8_47]|nr:MAG: flagellar biosynthesis protein flip [Gammaproteobacteria bacterium SG8_47]